MSLIALVSAGNAPGVTTAAFAMTLSWPDGVLLAECAPAGGHLLAGYFHGAFPADRGIWHLAFDLQQGRQPEPAALISEHTLALDGEGHRLLLPGARGPFQLSDFSPDIWAEIAERFRMLPTDVIADVGPIGADLPFPLIHAADLVVLVLRPSFAQAAAARPRVDALRQALGDGAPLALCLIGKGDYRVDDFNSSLGGFVDSIELPTDERSARVLHEGVPAGKGFSNGQLMRAAAAGGRRLRRSAAAQRQVVYGEPPVTPSPAMGGSR